MKQQWLVAVIWHVGKFTYLRWNLNIIMIHHCWQKHLKISFSNHAFTTMIFHYMMQQLLVTVIWHVGKFIFLRWNLYNIMIHHGWQALICFLKSHLRMRSCITWCSNGWWFGSEIMEKFKFQNWIIYILIIRHGWEKILETLFS